MLSIGWIFKVLILISLSITVRSVPTDKAVSEEDTRGTEAIDYALEAEAMKMPIIGNVLRYVSTMYADKLDYTWVEKSFGKQPDFCHNYECPKYKVLCKNIFYEVRKYEPAKWVKVPIKYDPSSSDEDIIGIAFKKLYNYIKGARIEMTVPVVVNVAQYNINQEKPPYEIMAMLFYIPSASNKDTPEPTDENVKIIATPEVVMYVKMFGGYVLSSVWKPMADRFHKVLAEYKQKVDPIFGYGGATYDKPSILMNRHNEIMFLAAEEKEDEKYCQLS